MVGAHLQNFRCLPLPVVMKACVDDEMLEGASAVRWREEGGGGGMFEVFDVGLLEALDDGLLETLDEGLLEALRRS